MLRLSWIPGAICRFLTVLNEITFIIFFFSYNTFFLLHTTLQMCDYRPCSFIFFLFALLFVRFLLNSNSDFTNFLQEM